MFQIKRGDFVPFAENFQYCMDVRKYSNYRMSKILGCTPTSITNWASGERNPHKKTKLAIANHFGITIEELDGPDFPKIKIQEKEQKEKPPAGSREPVGPKKQTLLNLVGPMSESEAGVVLDLITAMRKARDMG